MDVDYSKLTLKPQEIDMVIYHGKCCDGFGSALASYIYFKNENGINANGKKVTYHPASFYQSPPPVTGLNVLICDFSYKKDVMKQLINDSKCLAILDHHISAEIELTDIGEENKVFRMDHSGAYLTWGYFFPNQQIPLLIKYIEDNDIWLKAMPHTREITAYIFSLPFEFEEYEKLLDEKVLMTDILPVANGMYKQVEINITDALGYITMKFTQIDGMYYFVASTNSSVLKSEIGNRIFSKYLNANFSSIYSISNSTSHISLRSTNDRTDVSKIAGKFGGGGHKCASGMSMYGSHDVGNVLDVTTLYNLLDNIYVKESSFLNENIVYLNVTHCKKQMGKYLLQNRYFNEETKKHVQECVSILHNRQKYKQKYDNINLSCIWNYDGEHDKNWFSVCWCDDYPNVESLSNKLRNENDFQQINSDKRIIFSRKGVKSTI